jgi:hypothetical protein
MGGAVLQADDRQPPHGLVVVCSRQPVEGRSNGVDRTRSVARKQFQRDQRRAAAGRALVVEPAREQLDLLAKAELPDGPIRDRPFTVVGAPGIRLDLVLPLAPEIREPPLVARLSEFVRLGGCLLEGQDVVAVSERGGGPT